MRHFEIGMVHDIKKSYSGKLWIDKGCPLWSSWLFCEMDTLKEYGF